MALSSETHERREQPGDVKATARRPEKADSEGDERNGQVDDDEATQPRKRAPQCPLRHRERSFLRSFGTEERPLTLGGVMGTTPFLQEDLLPRLAKEERHEGTRRCLVRRTVEHRDGVVPGEIRPGERHGLDIGRGGFDAVEEPGIELPGLQLTQRATSQGRRLTSTTRWPARRSDVVGLGRLVERG